MKKYETPEFELLLLKAEKDFLAASDESGDAYQDDNNNDDFGFHF